ncbi:MAG: hypothetical protein HDR12_03435 [Lachnospiraceae bacterium]|nr:hypothetical protein [Lachnospiraceae bacterium]
MNGKKTIKNLKKLYILILCSLLFLFGCGVSDKPIQYEENDISIEEPEEETANYSDEKQKEFEIVNTYEDCEKYSSLLKKAWIVDDAEELHEGFEFIITRVNNEEIEGYIVISDAITWYWSNSELGSRLCKPFKGTITGNQANCVFEYEECQVEAVFMFYENDRIEASIKCEKLDINEGYRFRPYNLSDEQLHDDISSTPVFFEAWGEVNLVSATSDSRHSIPEFFITNSNGDILYQENCMNGFVFWDVFVEDINQDGRLDIWTVICGELSPEGGRMVDIFYQAENGYFYDEQKQSEEMPEEYYGEYRVMQFCPTEDYDEISEQVLTQQEVEEMLGKEIVIQDGPFVSYDSERRTGTREDRGLSSNDSMIAEYRDTYAEYTWRLASPDILINNSYPDEKLRDAVGEEYYDKINGVFYNIYLGWQQFYTLEGEEKLIMHSMLTGQNFILER